MPKTDFQHLGTVAAETLIQIQHGILVIDAELRLSYQWHAVAPQSYALTQTRKLRMERLCAPGTVESWSYFCS